MSLDIQIKPANVDSGYNPDVLTCLANLSNDEVFTPPSLANAMLDQLPDEIWSDSNAKFLDPVSKSGVFLREIAKRLMVGLEGEMPDIQERINHIYTKQLYGIGITELTALLSRRSLYCSKYANGKYSIVSTFPNEEGNIDFSRVEHKWFNDHCVFCGASQSEYDRSEDLETHAYKFIHTNKPEELYDMKFDVIIGNPPYQLNVGNEGGNVAKARAIYHNFISQAMKLNPRYLTMIIPSRWMTRSTEGIPDEWIDNMIQDKRIRVMHDYLSAGSVFPGVEIKGGVCYFLWDRDNPGKCERFLHKDEDKTESITEFLDPIGAGVVIRDIDAISILEKIQLVDDGYMNDDARNFTGLVSPKDFFTNKEKLTSSWKGYSERQSSSKNIKYYLNKSVLKSGFAWVEKSDIPKNLATIPLHKVYIPAAGGSGTDSQVLGHPFYGEPNSVCSQTYLVIGYDPSRHNLSENDCMNIITYIRSRFFRYLVSLRKKTQNGPRNVYQFVPMQDFSEEWDDQKLYDKYNLSSHEIEIIESTIRTMEPGK